MSSVSDELAALEHSAYEWQLKIFNSHIDILTEEEQRVRSTIDNVKQQLAGKFLEFSFLHFLQWFDAIDWLVCEKVAAIFQFLNFFSVTHLAYVFYAFVICD